MQFFNQLAKKLEMQKINIGNQYYEKILHWEHVLKIVSSLEFYLKKNNNKPAYSLTVPGIWCEYVTDSRKIKR